MQIVNESLYTIEFPKRSTKIRLHNMKAVPELKELLQHAQVKFDEINESELNIHLICNKLLAKIEEVMKKHTTTTLMGEHQFAQALATDLRTGALIRSL